MISQLRLKFGPTSGAVAQTIPTTPITVFVGPNNSGKSKVLSEIEQYCRSGQKNSTFVILDDLAFAAFTPESAIRAIEHIQQPANPGEGIQLDHILVGGRQGRQQVHLKNLTQVLQNPLSNVGAYCQWFLNFNTLMLDGRSRINLVNHQSAGDLQQSPTSSFQVLFKNDDKRAEVRRIVHEAFGSYFVVDPTGMGHLRIRLSDHPPTTPIQERGIHADAVAFHGKAQLIDFASDGVKAFTGMISELIAGDPGVVLIDEPEAFLHPSLAFKLGMEVSRAALKTDKRVFVSTHSPNFVMGCIQSGAPVNIIRLTYRGGRATARHLPSEEIVTLMRNPLLRSIGVLSGLFYEFVVVTESDTDRAFYQEINERLLRFKPEWGIPNCLFLHAQNKQTIKTVLQPLRKLGIPAAGIVDVDVFKEGGSVWTSLLESAYVPEITRNALATMRGAVLKAMEVTGLDMKKDGGLTILQGGEQEAARTLMKQLEEYGVFVVPGGELESWLTSKSIAGKGPPWLVKMFESMGDDPENSAYAKPTDDDIWQFISLIRTWLTNPDRRGIPG
jgi:ABC-type cobalamin/Fe3+-siderophores transport system ATPase subunit